MENNSGLNEEVRSSPLYNEDLAPTPESQRTWSKWNIAAIWVGMAVCIPTYILASYMIKSGVQWQVALIIIGLANLIITIPMVLNGEAGVKYGVPFPVLGRAAFGTKGIHIPAILRGLVACGWFGVQTWIGGLAFYAIWNIITGNQGSLGHDIGKFISFGLFWFVNIYFIWKGSESIKWLESLSAPILILLGILLIIWGANKAGGFGVVFDEGQQLENPAVTLMITENENELSLILNPLKNPDGSLKANEFQYEIAKYESAALKSDWIRIDESQRYSLPDANIKDVQSGNEVIIVQYRIEDNGKYIYSSLAKASIDIPTDDKFTDKIWMYLLWLTAMVGFWATMSISISDITRYAKNQKDQVIGQFVGLPGTMVLYSFVAIFVTSAAVINFKDVLIANDAPWDPVSLIARFDNPIVVVIAQIFMIIATLSTNIAANVIAPANAFANLSPKKISFRLGGVITGIIGILIMPWWLLDEISNFLVFVSGLLGPVLGILICDYFVIRKKKLSVNDLFMTNGIYTFKKGVNYCAMISLAVGIISALIGYWVPAVDFLYNLSWFTGFIISFCLYYVLMNKPTGVEN